LLFGDMVKRYEADIFVLVAQEHQINAATANWPRRPHGVKVPQQANDTLVTARLLAFDSTKDDTKLQHDVLHVERDAPVHLMPDAACASTYDFTLTPADSRCAAHTCTCT
jgi:hypothetical protein